MEHFVEESALLTLWQVNSEKKMCICNNFLIWVIVKKCSIFKAPDESNEETLFVSLDDRDL